MIRCMYAGQEKIIFFLRAQPGDKYFLQGNSMVIMTFFEKKSCQEFSEAIGNNSELKY